MMLIRHLAVLGALAALAMAHPSAANKSDSKSSKHMSKKAKSKPHTMAHPSTAKRSKGKGEKSKSKGDKSKSKGDKSKSKGDKSKSKGDESKSKDEKSKSKGDESKSKDEKSKSKGEESKSGKSKKHHKDECPCFDEGDLDSFLSFAAETDSCYYSEYISEDSTSLYVSADYLSDDNIIISRSLGADSFDYDGTAGGYCSSSLSASGTDPTSPFDTKKNAKGLEENKSSLMVPSEIFSECQALIEDLKGPMEALGCVISSSVYPCPFPCVNGDCTEDGCICYPGWTGDSCEECDESECVNGVCTVSGCVCDKNFAGPPCTECAYGWTGDNCDQCDPSACLNGFCTDTGCVCNVGWTGPNCDYCDVGWTGPNCDRCDFGWAGNNCDTCDPGLCADGYCSSCKNGQCTTGSGCVCDVGWFGDKCDRAYGDGCPCFNEADVEYFLNFAEIAGANFGYCAYEDYTYTDVSFYLSLYASSYSGTSSSIFVSDTQCSSFRTDGISVPITAEEAGECRDVILNTDAKDQMEAFGCDIIENTGIEGGDPGPLMNGK